jgi:hypothetical protein
MNEADGLRRELDQKSTEELISILRNRDEEEWRPEVFPVVAAVLKSRGVSPDDATAMGPEGVDVVESEPTVTIASAFSAVEGHALRMALEEAGLPAWVIDEAGGTMYGVGIGVRVQVRAKDADAAREVLARPAVSGQDLPPELGEPACPACGSRNVAPEAWVDETGSAAPGQHPTRRKWYHVCADCQEAWPVEEEVPTVDR